MELKAETRDQVLTRARHHVLNATILPEASSVGTVSAEAVTQALAMFVRPTEPILAYADQQRLRDASGHGLGTHEVEFLLLTTTRCVRCTLSAEGMKWREVAEGKPLSVELLADVAWSQTEASKWWIDQEESRPVRVRIRLPLGLYDETSERPYWEWCAVPGTSHMVRPMMMFNQWSEALASLQAGT